MNSESDTGWLQCTLDHIAINAVDIEAMLEFYTQVIGLQPERVERWRAGEVLFPSVRLNADTLIDLFPPAMWKGTSLNPQPVALNHFCITVSRVDYERIIERLGALDAGLDPQASTRWGAHGDATSRYFNDPDGNRLEIRYY
ncbi:MAG: VOC family protein [Gammaproteobacteria bacterium]|nr:VOC family protein [Gammaproteobacteria bacterium]